MPRELDILNPLVFGACLAILSAVAYFESGASAALLAPPTLSSFWLPVKIYVSGSKLYALLYVLLVAAMFFWGLEIVAGLSLVAFLIIYLGAKAIVFFNGR